MAPPRKTIAQYEAEATWIDGCLIRPNGGARHIYRLRHGDNYPHGNNKTGLCVCHTCDRPKCILDAHHYLGTRKRNTADAVARKRHSGFRKGGIRFGGPHNEASCRKIGMASKQRWSDPAYKERLKAAHRLGWRKRRAN